MGLDMMVVMLLRNLRNSQRSWILPLFWISAFWLLPMAKLRPSTTAFDKSLEDYLTQFGYLPTSSSHSMRTQRQVENALKNLQFLAQIEVTGLMDENTRDLITRPRCGVPDISGTGYRNRRHLRVRRFNIQGERWPSSNVSWSLRRPSPHLEVDAQRRELAAALKMWSQESSLRFTELTGEEAGKADIQVFFFSGPHYDGYPFDGYGTVLAHAFFPGSGRGGDAHFDADEVWTTDERTVSKYRASVFAVAIHEFGHSLGLSHSSVEGSLMYPWYSMEIPADARLPLDDRVAIQHLYGPNLDQHDSQALATTIDPTHSLLHHLPTQRSKTIFVESNSPDKCNTDFDAVAVIRSEMWAFKSRHFWRIHSSNSNWRNGGSPSSRSSSDASSRGDHDDPVELTAFWYGLPADVDKVDAVYERPDHKIVFFAGAYFYVLAGNSQLEQGPTPLAHLGLPGDLSHIDAAMTWGYNGKTFFFSGDKYWRYDDEVGRVELDYPRDIGMWRGVPSGIDAAFQYIDGKTYFFQGRHFWQFDDYSMRVVDPMPKTIGTHWMQCPPQHELTMPANPFDSNPSYNQAPTDSRFPAWLLVILALSLPSLMPQLC